MPQKPTQPLTDRKALDHQRARALAMPEPARFLHDAAIAETQERLGMVNRTFSKMAFVTGFSQFWAPAFPGAFFTTDQEHLDLPPGQFDLVVHGMGLHWANDPVGQLAQCRRALRPDGLLLCLCFGGRTLFELRHCLAEAESSLRGGLAPRVAPMGEIRDLGALLQRAGLAMPVADSLPLQVHYPGFFPLLRDLRAMGETNALAARDRRPLPRRVLHRAAELYAERFGDAHGQLVATFEIITLTGWAPSDDQPKPLRPGSARQSLAEALDPNRPQAQRRSPFDEN